MKDIGWLKLSLVLFQLLIMLVMAPLTSAFMADLLGGALINGLTLSILFFLNAYGYYKCFNKTLPKVGHLLSFIAIAFQGSLPLYIIATITLAIESYLVLTEQIPFHLKNWIHK